MMALGKGSIGWMVVSSGGGGGSAHMGTKVVAVCSLTITFVGVGTFWLSALVGLGRGPRGVVVSSTPFGVGGGHHDVVAGRQLRERMFGLVGELHLLALGLGLSLTVASNHRGFG